MQLFASCRHVAGGGGGGGGGYKSIYLFAYFSALGLIMGPCLQLHFNKTLSDLLISLASLFFTPILLFE